MHIKRGIFAVILILVMGLILGSCAPKVDGGQPDAQVLSNGKIAAAQGDYIYYINGSMPGMLDEALSGGSQAAIYRMDKEGKREKITNKAAYDFRIYQDLIYFISPEDEEQLAVYMTKITGGGVQRIINIDAGATYYLGETAIGVEKDQGISIIEIRTNQITHVNLDEEYKGDISQIYISDTHAYYYVENRAGIRQLDLNNLTKAPVTVSDRNGKIFGIYDNHLYYERTDAYLTKIDLSESFANNRIPDGEELSASLYDNLLLSPDYSAIAGVSSEEGKEGLYVMTLDGSARTKVTNERPTAILAGEDRVYFTMPSERALYSVGYDGKNLTKLCDAGAVAGPGVSGADYYMDEVKGQIYFFDSANNGNVWRVDGQGNAQSLLEK